MHYSVQAWCTARTEDHGAFANVLEMGGLDVNGGVRHLIAHDRWFAVDIVDGPGVNRVADAHDLGDIVADHSCDLVLCLEMLEHDSDPNATFATIARTLTYDGIALVTTRSEGFPLHHEPDYWRFAFADIEALAFTAGLTVATIVDDPQAGHPGVFAELRH